MTPNKLYLDVDDGFLYYREGDNAKPVTTNVSFFKNSIRLTEEGNLEIRDITYNNWEQVTDSEGKPVCLKGQDGKDGITPQLKIEDGYWYISYDGVKWKKLGKTIEDSLLDSKQDKVADGLVPGKGNVTAAINETFYNIWNPVHSAHFGGMSSSKIVLANNGELKLIWKYGDSADSPELSTSVTNDFTEHPTTVYFADRNYVTTFPTNENISSLNTSNKTIVGAINELALLHDLTKTISHTCAEGSSIRFHQIENSPFAAGTYILSGTVNSDPEYADVCVLAIPNKQSAIAYSNPSSWPNLAEGQYMYGYDIKVISFGEEFTLDGDCTLYLAFISKSELANRIPSAFGDPDAWVYSAGGTQATGATIVVSDLNIIPASESQAKQLENQQEIIDRLSSQVQSLQTQLLELQNKISWLDQLDQEGLIKSWGKEANL